MANTRQRQKYRYLLQNCQCNNNNNDTSSLRFQYNQQSTINNQQSTNNPIEIQVLQKYNQFKKLLSFL
jgi:hypothetical protein